MDEETLTELLVRINDEAKAMRQGLSGLAAGSSKHAVIQAGMDRLAGMHDKLSREIGEDASLETISRLISAK